MVRIHLPLALALNFLCDPSIKNKTAMNITEAQVKNWYQNRRSRWKNENVNNVINFTEIQLEGLEWEFKKNPRIDEQERIKV